MIALFFCWTHCVLSTVTIETIIYTGVRNHSAVKLQCGLSLMIYTHAASVCCACAYVAVHAYFHGK